jgi:hypothetical protein
LFFITFYSNFFFSTFFLVEGRLGGVLLLHPHQVEVLLRMHLTGEMYLFCLQLLPSTVKALPSHGNMFIASKKIPPNHCAMSFGVETIFSDPILSFCALSPLVWRAGHTRDGDSTNIWLPWQFGNPVSSVLD